MLRFPAQIDKICGYRWFIWELLPIKQNIFPRVFRFYAVIGAFRQPPIL